MCTDAASALFCFLMSSSKLHSHHIKLNANRNLDIRIEIKLDTSTPRRDFPPSALFLQGKFAFSILENNCVAPHIRCCTVHFVVAVSCKAISNCTYLQYLGMQFLQGNYFSENNLNFQSDIEDVEVGIDHFFMLSGNQSKSRKQKICIR